MRKNKQDELWDDSALINAFNDAISKYKKMHIQGSQVSSADGQEHAGRVDEISDDNKVPSNSAAETEENGNVPTVKESSFLESEAPEDHVVSSTGQGIHQEPVGYLNLQTTEHYNQLVNKYYELEDQRQKILQQLNQFGYWNYDSGLTASVSQEPETSTSQAYPTVSSSFCPYGCQSWVAPCTSVPCYFSGGACAGNSCNASAKEQALSSLKEQACANCDASVNEGKEKQSQKNFCHLEKSTSSETDLTVVLNAWYSAGFYTGKYLTEQSSARHGHD
ncbi:unnamed protein product [Coffea canephora]|uniref:Survival Motor Neuron Gemin2-binding domain-containing protein n=1 Tax=Coffea canephora TaxID=49390 RepID=A0A068UTR6_COFCA|nr:unnamed protein product [Coffea canephora]